MIWRVPLIEAVGRPPSAVNVPPLFVIVIKFVGSEVMTLTTFEPRFTFSKTKQYFPVSLKYEISILNAMLALSDAKAVVEV